MASVNAMERKQQKDSVLLKLIMSLDFNKAVALLQKNHSFSQDELDKALISACWHGKYLLVRTLVHSGANVHCIDSSRNTALMNCLKNGCPRMVRFLLEKKVDVNATNSAGDSALILSVRSSGSIEITKLLLEQPGIQLHHQNKDGFSALKKAIWVRNFEAAGMLLDTYIKDKSANQLKIDCHMQRTAQNIAQNVGDGSTVQHVRPQEKQTIVTDQPQVKNKVGTSSSRPDGAILDCKFDEMLKYIFQNCDKNTIKGFSESQMTIIKKLLECGADPSVTWLNLSKTFNLFEIDESCEMKDLNKLIKTSNRSKETPLKIAAQIGHCRLAELLLKNKAKVDEDHFLQSALHLALHRRHTNCARLLLQHGAKMHVIYALVSAVIYKVASYMEFICENFRDEVVNILQKFNNLNVFVRAAVRGGNLQILTQIFEVGVDCSNVKLPLTETRNEQIVRFLIEKGAKVNLPKKQEHLRKTPLLNVITNRKYSMTDTKMIQVIQVLLENGASVYSTNCKRQTPLTVAVRRHGSKALLQLLLDHGADLGSKDCQGNNALFYAITTGLECVSFLIQLAKARKDVLNAQNNEGSTALMVAATMQRTDLMKELVSAGSDVNIVNKHGDTVIFHYLTKAYSPVKELLLMLVNENTDIIRCNKDGLSLLMVAAKRCLPWAIKILVDSGADVNLVSTKDKTKTALSFVPVNISMCEDAGLCIVHLLEEGADASYVNPRCLHEQILSVCNDYIPLLIRSGLGPSEVPLHETKTFGIEDLPTASPLCLAFMVGNVPLAQYFVDNAFLTRSDVTMLSDNEWRDFQYRKKHLQPAKFLDTVASRPWSLFNLALVAVSSAVGTSPGRKSRVNRLPLQENLKQKLLYRADNMELMPPGDPDIISQIQFRASRIKKLGKYYMKTRFLCETSHNFDGDFELNSEINNDLSDDAEDDFNLSASGSDIALETGSNNSYFSDSDA